MSANTKIEWAHHSVNFWWGCTFARFLDGTIRPECMHCYAKLLASLFSRGKATWGADGKRWIRHEAARRELYKLDRLAFDRGVRERVFINSMSDTFEDRDDLNEARGFLWDACKFVTNLDILLLTKRPQNVMRMVPADWRENWPAHVWIGTTTGTQKAANENIPALLAVPARVRFLSCEPLLETVDLTRIPDGANGPAFSALTGLYARDCFPPDITLPIPWPSRIDWVICGGESGAGARPMHPDWARTLRDLCAANGVAFFFKQWGAHAPGFDEGRYTYGGAEKKHHVWLTTDGKNSGSCWIVDDDGTWSNWTGDPPTNPDGSVTDAVAIMHPCGKGDAGRLLDGVEHNAVPEVRG